MEGELYEQEIRSLCCVVSFSFHQHQINLGIAINLDVLSKSVRIWNDHYMNKLRSKSHTWNYWIHWNICDKMFTNKHLLNNSAMFFPSIDHLTFISLNFPNRVRRLVSWRLASFLLVIIFYWRPTETMTHFNYNHECDSLISDNVPLKIGREK